MKAYDIAIIGGGIIGVSIARELSRFRLRVALFEKEEELSFGVSKSNSGIIHPGTQVPSNSLKGKLCVKGNFLTRKIARELGVDFQEVGELIVIFNSEELPSLIEIKDEAEKLGVCGLKIVDKAWLRDNEPNLNREALCALYAPSAGIISPYRMVYDIGENAVRNGIEIYTQAKVEAIDKKTPGHFELITTKGMFDARYVINAGGLYADYVSRMAGVDNFKIHPRKGEEFILDKKRQYLTKHLLFPLPSKISKGVLVIKTSDGNPMVGPTAEDVDSKEDLSTSDESFKKVFASVQKLVPSISQNDVIAYFAGLRPVSGDDFIIRHEDSAKGFINVAGIQSPGLTAAPAIAIMVSDILKNNGLALKRKPFFHCRRKRTIHLFKIPLSLAKRIIKKDFSYGDIVCRCEMVSEKEIKEAIKRGAKTLDGIKFRTRAQAGRCHGSFCTTRIMRILSKETKRPLVSITKRGLGSLVVKKDRTHD